jgi:putative addiction module component (TIGR02574 family)
MKEVSMRTTQIRQQLHDYIDSVEEKKLKAIYTLLESEISEGYQLTAAQKAELDKRYSDYQNGIGKTYTWDETVAIAEQTLAARRK